MATALTPVVAVIAGADATPAAVDAAGNYFTNNGREIIIVTNTNVAAVTVAIASPATYKGLALGDIGPVSVPQNKTYVFPPLDPSIYNDSVGRVNIVWGGTTTDAKVVVVTAPPVA